MPFCQNCGRPLNEGEVCNCRNQQGAPQPSPYMNNPNQPNPQGMPYPNPRQPGQPYQYQNVYQDPNQQPKKQNKALIGCLIAAAVGAVTLPVLAILAAILVPAIIGYNMKANTASANTAAKSCYNAAATALAEADEAKTLRPGTYILTNIPGKSDVNAPFDTADLHSSIERYFTEAAGEDYWYFVVVEGKMPTYTAVWSDAHSNVIGTYPNHAEPREAVGYDGKVVDVTSGDNTFRELFDDASRDLIALPGDKEES